MEFVKLYKGFWSGSMSDEKPYTKLVFIALLSLSDDYGNAHAGVSFLSKMTGVEEWDVEEALKRLQAPDPASTTEGNNGRRLILKGPNRWFIVNYRLYYEKSREEERKSYKQDWQRRKRTEDTLRTDEDSCGQLRTNEDTAFLEREKESERESESEIQDSPPKSPKGDLASEVVEFLNTTCGRAFHLNGKYPELRARLKAGATVDDCKRVIAEKFRQWRGTDQAKYLNPTTLFRACHWDVYLEEAKFHQGFATPEEAAKLTTRGANG